MYALLLAVALVADVPYMDIQPFPAPACTADCACHKPTQKPVKSALTNYTGILWICTSECPACKSMAPTVEKLVLEGKPIVIVVVAPQDAATRYGLRYVPATLAYRRGELIEKVEHAISEKELRQRLAAVGEK